MTVFGINNQGASSHRAFAEKHGFDAPLLVDADFKVSSAYDAVMGFGPLRIINRTVVVVATDGTIRKYQRGMPETDEILAAIPAAA